LARQATEKLEDKRQEFQKWQQLNNQEFQREQFEKQKQLQKELAEDNRQTQLKVALEQRNTARQVVQDQKLFQNWPLRIVPDQILNANHDENLLSLRIIPAPPVIDFDQFGGNNKSFPNIETGLAQGLREFFNQHYSFQSTERPIELIDGGWDSKRYHGGAAIIGLFALLKSEPMLILESQIDGDYLHLNVGYWGEGQQKYFYQSIISNLPYREVVYESVKIRARQWREKREQLAKQLNKSSEEIDRQYGSDNAFNLKILQDEEALKSAGIDSSDLATQPYKVTAKDFEYLCQFLVKCQSLVGGWIADIHYLIHHNVPPILPKLIPDLMRGIDDPKLLKTIVSGYRQVYEALENERPAWMPELALDLADSLTALPDKNWAREQLDYSVKSWLRLRGINPPNNLEQAIKAMKSVVTVADEVYFNKLHHCLAELESRQLATQVKGLLSEQLSAESFYQRSINSNAQFFDFQAVTVDSRGKEVKREKKPARYFTENLGNGVTLEMVAIPAGQFKMGSPDGQGNDNERPQHLVTVPAFFMGKYPITQAQWKAVASLPKIERDLSLNPSKFSGNNRPVEQVSWYAAVEFCMRLSKATGRDYRLPSEAQWEYACRAGTTTPFYFGETITPDLANYNGNSIYAQGHKGVYRQETTPVGKFPPNAFGLYDMHGNVWEWCADTWHDNYKDAPRDGSVWIKNGDDNRSPLRGGSWFYYPDFCRSAYRDYYSRHVALNRNNGFRVVCGAGRTL
jgi:formylglycine-generating enzyme required for sulfatase activity